MFVDTNLPKDSSQIPVSPLLNDNCLLLGGPGTGKSQLLKRMLQELRRRDEKVLVIETGDLGSMAQVEEDHFLFYENIKNRDERCLLFREEELGDTNSRMQFASLLLPMTEECERYFRKAAQILLHEFLEASKCIEDLVLFISGEHSALEEFREDKKPRDVGKMIASFLESRNSPNANGILLGKNKELLAAIHTSLRPLILPLGRTIKHGHDVRDFIFSEWHQDRNTHSWAFVKQDKFQNNDSSARLALDCFLRSIRKNSAENTKKLWIVIDEIGTLARVHELLSVLQNSKTLNVQFLVSVQNIIQIRKVIGKTQMQEFLDSFATRLFFSCDLETIRNIAAPELRAPLLEVHSGECLIDNQDMKPLFRRERKAEYAERL